MKTMNVLIKGVTRPGSVCKIASNRGIAVGDVFVRVIFEYNDEEYAVSQKVKYLPQEDYKRLLEAEASEGYVCLDIDIEKGFFNIHTDDVEVAELYKSTETRTSNVKSLKDLF